MWLGDVNRFSVPFIPCDNGNIHAQQLLHYEQMLYNCCMRRFQKTEAKFYRINDFIPAYRSDHKAQGRLG